MQRWDEVEQFLVDEAARDLEAGATVRPCLAAFRGEQPLLIVFLREFDKGAYADPITEVLCIAMGLAADRLMFSISGRAWSLDDPVPPVVPGFGDLRQRIVHITRVDGSGAAICARDIMLPFDVRDGVVQWGPRLEEESAEGWIPRVLRIAVEQCSALAASDADLRAQVLRCDRLGHLVGISPEVSQRLALEPSALEGL